MRDSVCSAGVSGLGCLKPASTSSEVGVSISLLQFVFKNLELDLDLIEGVCKSFVQILQSIHLTRADFKLLAAKTERVCIFVNRRFKSFDTADIGMHEVSLCLGQGLVSRDFSSCKQTFYGF